ncbi:bifunctional 2-polyprenyl-6-hydroxyphenol methylase/3-demethylubiquinol 3-O-methyltransferase UbiG [Streptomyces sp. MBT62]|uniref:class I SAM-dependent methyltransferase n=1 Tax=Streptomyces sp. MBT62 TaxID=2800410 RepID=UPI00190DB156|nr:class I SAM-dependent methyltransferase [Streptomyces sp. MBT62]MBK3564469.1 class I SAM-dependent methyltransferase [Streptomyces sp. MBT62]
MIAVDLACGTGQWTRQLASLDMTVTGYDYSDEALRQTEVAGPREGLSYALWDIVADPIPRHLVPMAFDLITCRDGLPYLEPGRLLTDVGRWLKPDGIFYALVRVGQAHACSNPTGCQGRDGETADESLFRREISEAHLGHIGAGWTRREVHRLGRRHRAILLSGYGGPQSQEPAAGEPRIPTGVDAARPMAAMLAVDSSPGHQGGIRRMPAVQLEMR